MMSTFCLLENVSDEFGDCFSDHMYIETIPYIPRNRTQISGSFELKLSFLDPVLVKPEWEVHLENPVWVIKTGTVVSEFQFEQESQRNLNIIVLA